MIPTREDVALIKQYVELRGLVDDIIELKYNKILRSSSTVAAKWVAKASKQLRKYLLEETLKEIGVDRETRTLLGYS